ncbi:MAG: hypothetical protein WCO81_12725, partial [Cyanobacteriota bacterium ELA615]
MPDLQNSNNFSSDRFGALEATSNFAVGTIGYGVHQVIDELYQLIDNFGSAQIGSFFQRSDVQELMQKPISDESSNLKVAQLEYQYWTSVSKDPNSTELDKLGAQMALLFSPTDRAQIQKDFATGEFVDMLFAQTLIVKTLGENIINGKIEGIIFDGAVDFMYNSANDIYNSINNFIQDYLHYYNMTDNSPRGSSITFEAVGNHPLYVDYSVNNSLDSNYSNSWDSPFNYDTSSYSNS